MKAIMYIWIYPNIDMTSDMIDSAISKATRSGRVLEMRHQGNKHMKSSIQKLRALSGSR
jgi:hypothetical protein